MIGRTAIAAVMVAVVSGQVSAEWQIIRRVDPLDAKAFEIAASVMAAESVTQFGRAVRASLVAECVEERPPRPIWIALAFQFSEPVTVADRLLRWRVDDLPIQERLAHPQAQGRALAIYSAHGPDPTVEQVRAGAKVLKAQIGLPWAGATALTFNVSGADKAFGQIHCK